MHSQEDGYLIKDPKGRPCSYNVPEDDLDIQSVRKSLMVDDGCNILLAFAWMTGAEKKLLCQFPDFISIDVTEKTNKEKRGLLLAAGIDGNCRTLTCLHVFMPNSQMRSFGWVYQVAIPHLWSNDILRKVSVVITDGEQALYLPVENLANTGGAWRNTLVYR